MGGKDSCSFGLIIGFAKTCVWVAPVMQGPDERRKGNRVACEVAISSQDVSFSQGGKKACESDGKELLRKKGTWKWPWNPPLLNSLALGGQVPGQGKSSGSATSATLSVV